MKTELDLVRLAIYMWERLDEAVTELPPCPPSELFERFLKWTGPH